MKARVNGLAGVVSALWLIFVALPIYAIIMVSISSRENYLAEGPISLPASITLDNYVKVLTGAFPSYFVNTAFVTVAVVCITVGLALPIGYAVVRGRGLAQRSTFRLFLLGLAIPAQAVMIPIFWMMDALGLYDTLWAVILPTAAFSLPVAVLILTAGMRDIPEELYEAAALDGASSTRTFLRLVIPLSSPAIATIAVFTGMNAWNGFLFPLILTQSSDVKVLTLGLFEYVGLYGADIPALFAAVLLSALPIFAVYLLGRRFLVRGLLGVGGK